MGELYLMTKFLGRTDLPPLGITYCDMSLRRLEKAGLFPRRRHLGPRRVAWVAAEIERYLADKAAHTV
jgi:hypothetical protein